jgi:hypothetical protein
VKNTPQTVQPHFNISVNNILALNRRTQSKKMAPHRNTSTQVNALAVQLVWWLIPLLLSIRDNIDGPTIATSGDDRGGGGGGCRDRAPGTIILVGGSIDWAPAASSLRSALPTPSIVAPRPEAPVFGCGKATGKVESDVEESVADSRRRRQRELFITGMGKVGGVWRHKVRGSGHIKCGDGARCGCRSN